jgi:hypothetical protein
MEAQRVAELQRQQQQMAEFLQYMQAVEQKKTGVDVPASLLVVLPPPPPPLVHATPISMSMII